MKWKARRLPRFFYCFFHMQIYVRKNSLKISNNRKKYMKNRGFTNVNPSKTGQSLHLITPKWPGVYKIQPWKTKKCTFVNLYFFQDYAIFFSETDSCLEGNKKICNINRMDSNGDALPGIQKIIVRISPLPCRKKKITKKGKKVYYL